MALQTLNSTPFTKYIPFADSADGAIDLGSSGLVTCGTLSAATLSANVVQAQSLTVSSGPVELHGAVNCSNNVDIQGAFNFGCNSGTGTYRTFMKFGSDGSVLSGYLCPDSAGIIKLVSQDPNPPD